MFKQIGLMTFVLSFLSGGFAVAPSYGQAATDTDNFLQPFASSGIPLCGGEEVFFSGVAHFLFHTTVDAHGKVHTRMHMNYMESTAVSASGVPYQVNESQSFTVNQRDSGGIFHTVINGQLISKGPGVNTAFHMILQTVIGPDGEPKTIVEHVDTRCSPR